MTENHALSNAKTALSVDKLTALVDRGYYRSEELRDCEEANITTYLPKPQTSGNQARGLFGRDAFSLYRRGRRV